MLVVLKDWRNSRIIEVAAILVSILMIVPSADAVDALKTCACLLKECRYAAIPLFLLPNVSSRDSTLNRAPTYNSLGIPAYAIELLLRLRYNLEHLQWYNCLFGCGDKN